MAISPDAIAKFLNRVLADPPPCKGMAPEQLKEMIYNCTGARYQPARAKLRPHQLEGLAFALYQRNSLLFYWMRLGKSLIALEWAAHLQRANLTRKKCLIIAHAPIGADVWAGQAKEHTYLDIRVVRSGAGSVDMLVDSLESDCDTIIMSRSTIQALFTEKRPNRKKELTLYPDHARLALVAEYFDHCVIDETHFYAAAYGLQSTLVQEIAAHCKFRLGLTGTPVGRDPFKIWAQTHLIDNGKHFGYNYRFFLEAFGKRKRDWFSPSGKTIVFDPAKMDIFQYKLDRLALSYGKGEIKSATVFAGKVRLRMGEDQRKAYNEVVQKLITMATGQEIEIKAIFIRLRQIASGYMPFVDEDGGKQIVHFDNVKLAWLREFAEATPENAQCLIFHEYVHTGAVICKALTAAKISHSWLHGKAKDKPGELARFKSGKSRFLVANSATGGTSIDIPEADYICFFESPVSPITRAQAEARPMARGDRPLMLDDLICAPVEDKILGFISEGENLLSKLLRGGSKLAKELFA